jgi:hypothetical protein
MRDFYETWKGMLLVVGLFIFSVAILSLIKAISASNVLTVIAIVTAPLFALRINTKVLEMKEAKQRKLEVFKTLMATRAARLSPKHIEALNSVEVEFYGSDKKSKKVFNAWKAYIDQLGHTPEGKEPSEEAWGKWIEKGTDLFTELISAMAEYLGYDFDPVHIKRHSYYPRLYGSMEEELTTIRKGLVRIFERKDMFPIYAIVAPARAEGTGSLDQGQGVVKPTE